MKFRRTCIINKLLYVISNDLVLTGLLVTAYFLMRFSPGNPLLIMILILFTGALFCFYYFRAKTVTGDIYDEGDNSYFVMLKIVFLFINGASLLVFFAPPAIAVILIILNTVLVSGTQYYRIILLAMGKYETCEGKVLSAKRIIARHGIRRGFSTINYVADFERDDGSTVSICVDRFTYHRIRGYPNATLVMYSFPKGRKYGELYIKNS